MSVFADYAPWYDLLYRDKDYAAEVDFVEARLCRAGMASGKLLDLGCGTGLHAIEFARRGWDVAGVDLSADMIARAKARAAQAGLKIPFRQGDACEVGAERDCDAVVSLFHVASYQNDHEHLAALFRTAHAALKPGGVFFFDYWYGGAVLAQGVETRVKMIEQPPLRLTRIAQSDHDEPKATVFVNYTLFCEDMDRSTIRRVDETHHMRYWFPFEVEAILRRCGFEPTGSHAWLSDAAPNVKDWGAYTIARKAAKP
ncbi:class I SAM-dependent DNA methyltransferase [Bradyrhizobium cajani]|uniref:Methyltransferase domain-containing protein n=1 Tax=Bradyrhizobium cajani TaxID=1928661 RepID=A0A844T698_9BRAD|nr:class I SAM-dependent methyltransferase [Bradyrhizobium cajani]MCP3371001.1 class I SAM-dependent methyltransferase [Bradyrhizobium cajani]MVT71584.1 methyltransferase domain-containing protein [Bradyrhizobium cajani]